MLIFISEMLFNRNAYSFFLLLILFAFLSLPGLFDTVFRIHTFISSFYSGTIPGNFV